MGIREGERGEVGRTEGKRERGGKERERGEKGRGKERGRGGKRGKGSRKEGKRWEEDKILLSSLQNGMESFLPDLVLSSQGSSDLQYTCLMGECAPN
jgi:hypothetical protein